MPFSITKAEAHIKQVFYFSQHHEIEDYNISPNAISNLYNYIKKNSPSTPEEHQDFIRWINRYWAPPRRKHIAEVFCIEKYQIEEKITGYYHPDAMDIEDCKKFSKQLLCLSEQPGIVGTAARGLLDFFVNSLSHLSTNKLQTWENVMASYVRFFQILRSVILDNQSRPFNDRLIAQAMRHVYAGTNNNNGKINMVNTLLRLPTTSPVSGWQLRSTSSHQLVCFFSSLKGESLPKKIILVLEKNRQKYRSEKSFLNPKALNDDIELKIVAITSLLNDIKEYFTADQILPIFNKWKNYNASRIEASLLMQIDTLLNIEEKTLKYK